MHTLHTCRFFFVLLAAFRAYLRLSKHGGEPRVDPDCQQGRTGCTGYPGEGARQRAEGGACGGGGECRRQHGAGIAKRIGEEQRSTKEGTGDEHGDESSALDAPSKKALADGGTSRPAPSAVGSVSDGSWNGRSSNRLSPMTTASVAASAPTPPLPPVASPYSRPTEAAPTPSAESMQASPSVKATAGRSMGGAPGSTDVRANPPVSTGASSARALM
eukprot:scaffold610_cov102-Isochrysis_galbana.AAC.2